MGAKPKTDGTVTRFCKILVRGLTQVVFATGASMLFLFAIFTSQYHNHMNGISDLFASMDEFKKESFRLSGVVMSTLLKYLGASGPYIAFSLFFISMGTLLRFVWDDPPSKGIPAALPLKTAATSQEHNKNRTEGEKPAETATRIDPPKKGSEITTTPGNHSQEAVASSENHTKFLENHKQSLEDNIENIQAVEESQPPSQSNWAAYLAIGIACPLALVGLACIYCKFCQKPTTSADSDVENINTTKNTTGPENAGEIIV